MKEYTIYIEQDEDGVYIGSVPSIAGCYSQGATIDELLVNMREALQLCLRNSGADGAIGTFVGVQKVAIPA